MLNDEIKKLIFFKKYQIEKIAIKIMEIKFDRKKNLRMMKLYKKMF